MQIAEQIVKQGTSSSTVFNDKLTELVTEYGITKVIETGTYKGLGTTSAILKGLAQGEPFEFYSIEVSPTNYKEAQRNLGTVKGLHLINGLSVDKGQRPVNTTLNYPDHVIVDHYPENRNELYFREVSFDVPDNMLEFALSKLGYQPHLVLLDSVGNMGWIEFEYLMERVSGSFLLALDDTCHVKHYDSLNYIKNNPAKFEVIWEVESEYINSQSGSKFGSAIIQVL